MRPGGLSFKPRRRRTKSTGYKTDRETLNNVNTEDAGRSFKQTGKEKKALLFIFALCLPGTGRAASRTRSLLARGAGPPGPPARSPSLAEGAGGDAPTLSGKEHLRSRSPVQSRVANARLRGPDKGVQAPRCPDTALDSAPRGAGRRRRGADSRQAVSFSLVFPEPSQRGANLNCRQSAPLCSWLRCQVPTVCWV